MENASPPAPGRAGADHVGPIDPGSRQGSNAHVERIARLRERLLRADGRNPSVLFPDQRRPAAMDVGALAPATAAATLRLALGLEQEVRLLGTAGAPEPEGPRANLERLQNAARRRHEATGLDDLAIGVGWVEGRIAQGMIVRGPLWLARVQLQERQERVEKGWWLQRDTEADPLEVNESLASVLRNELGIRVPSTPFLSAGLAHEDPAGWSKIAWGHVVSEACTIAHAATAGGSVPVGVRGGVRDIEPFAPQVIENTVRAPQTAAVNTSLEMRPWALLSLFPQAYTPLLSDLAAFAEVVAAMPTSSAGDESWLRTLLEIRRAGGLPSAPSGSSGLAGWRASLVRRDGNVATSPRPPILPSDPSQDAIRHASRSHWLTVVEGPPGTGKSQLLANLVGDAFERGERVAVLCQKPGALEVIRRRLESVGFEHMIGCVTHPEGDRGAVVEQVRGALAQRERMRGKSDALAQELADVEGQLARLIEDLRSLDDLSSRRIRGLPIGAIYADLVPHPSAHPTLPRSLLPQDADELERTTQFLAEVEAPARRFVNADHPLYARRPWGSLTLADRRRLQRAFADLATASRGLRTRAATIERRRASEAIRLAAPLMRWGWKRRMSRLLADRTAFERTAEAQKASLASDLAHICEFDARIARASRKERRLMRRLLTGERDAAESSIGPTPPWADHVRAETLSSWVAHFERSEPAAHLRVGARRDRVDSALRTALRRRADLLAQAMTAGIRQRSKWGAPSISAERALGADIAPRRRNPTLRSLFRRHSTAIFDLIPCWLFTPEAMADLIPRSPWTFDLIVVDEASQLPLERALPIFSRGQRIVVVGDENQLSPTRFFQEAPADQESGEDLPVSLLSMVSEFETVHSLRWHYRSDDPRLMAFSNAAFYGGSMELVGRPERAAPSPIHWVAVAGRWKDRCNRAEADVAVELLFQELQRGEAGEPASVGIIAFNAPQEQAILEAIDRRTRESDIARRVWEEATRPRFDGPGPTELPLVRNLENMQGEERETIILSVAYAPDETGVFRQNFGALNQEGGARRLNVAITRARRRLHVLCSFAPESLAERAVGTGAEQLRLFLLYARALGEGDAAEAERVLRTVSRRSERAPQPEPSRSLFDSPFEREVYEALVSLGFAVVPQWPVGSYRIDLAIVDPHDDRRFALAVECDGATYHQGRAARERDLVRQRFLETKGWRIARISSTDWRHDAQGEIDRVRSLLPKPHPAPVSHRAGAPAFSMTHTGEPNVQRLSRGTLGDPATSTATVPNR
ncbi:MAG: AAA domain-containing protein [Thermoplasmatota archaeon]